MKYSSMLLRRLFALLMAVTAILSATGLAVAQGAKPTLHILRIKQTGSSPLLGDLTDFALRLVKLRLAEMKSFATEEAATAEEQDVARLCERAQRSDSGGVAQLSLANEADFYVLRAAVEIRAREGAEAEVVLDYELSKYVRCERISLVRSKEPFAESEVLRYLNSMADVVALLLNKERTVTKAVANAYISGKDQKTWAIADKLTKMLRDEIKQSSDFNLPEKDAANAQPDFAIRGEVSGSNRLKYSVQIEIKRGYEYPKKTVVGPEVNKQTEESLAAFYKEAAFAAYDYLKYVRYVAEARRNTPLSGDEGVRMLDRASLLMCAGPTAPADCKEQPETAILILTEIKERQKTTDYALLARAQMLVGDYDDAAKSFDAARQLAADGAAEIVIGLLHQAGDAWFKAGKYENAIARYEESLSLYALNRNKLSASLLEKEPKVQLQRTRSYRYGNKGIEALKVILDAWDTQRDTTEIKQELSYLLSDLESSLLPEAGKVLEGYKGKPQYEVARPMLLKVVAADEVAEVVIYYLFNLDTSELQGEVFSEIDKKLKVVEALPPSLLDPDTRVLAQTLRALWYRDHKKDLKTAISLLEMASAEKDVEASATSRTFLAETYYQQARASTATDVRALYEKAAALISGQAKGGDTGSYMLLVAVNHELGKDQETRELLEDRGRQNEKDTYAFEALAELCVHYLFDLDCARKSIEAERSASGSPGVWWKSSGPLAEIDLFSGRYAEAQHEFERTDASMPSLLANFYSTWALFAMNKEPEAHAAARKWRSQMEEIRKVGRQVDVVQYGILRALDGETHLTPSQKELLRAMLIAMRDKTTPLPALP